MAELEKEKITYIKELLIEKLNPYLIYLFGSAAKGKMGEESDIDIGFLSDNKISSYDIFMIAQELADQLDREVDLVDLNQASTVFQMQVVSSGKVIYCNNDTRRKLFEMVVFKKYARLNEERRVIIEKVKERGTVYG
ncbi:MAG: nucleotidyltransferase domain-containing protein [Clostridia bacterium]|nr:nucleotidyltransferase domain-containing protein [Clostridia bacterium]